MPTRINQVLSRDAVESLYWAWQIGTLRIETHMDLVECCVVAVAQDTEASIPKVAALERDQVYLPSKGVGCVEIAARGPGRPTVRDLLLETTTLLLRYARMRQPGFGLHEQFWLREDGTPVPSEDLAERVEARYMWLRHLRSG